MERANTNARVIQLANQKLGWEGEGGGRKHLELFSELHKQSKIKMFVRIARAPLQ